MSNTVSGEIDRMAFSEESRHRGSGPRLVRAGLEQTGLGRCRPKAWISCLSPSGRVAGPAGEDSGGPGAEHGLY